MSEWKTYKWGDLISLEYGKPIPDKNLLDGQYPVYGTNGRIGTSNLTPLCKHPSIIVGRKGAYRGVHYSNKPFSVIDTAFFVEPKTSILDLKWAYYKLLTVNINKMDSGSAIPSTDRYEIYSLSVELPSLDEQRRIAGILGSLDDKIELNRRINANLEAQAQALFRSWFVDFEPFRDGPFVDSQLGKIPQGWKVGNYTDIVEIKGGGTPKTGIQEYWNGTIPFFSPKDVGASCFVLDTEKHITAKGLENCNSSLFQPNTVFITARGTVGKVVMTGTEMAMNQTNYALLGKQNISQYYVYHITLQLVARLLKKANGAVFNAITTRDFTSEQVVIPPFSTISQFSDVVKPIYENILLNDVQSNRLSALRDTLMPKLMAGEIAIE